MAITTDNILVGQGDLSIDGVALGATEGGFVLNQEQEWFDAMVDQSVGVQKKKLVRRRLFGKARKRRWQTSPSVTDCRQAASRDRLSHSEEPTGEP